MAEREQYAAIVEQWIPRIINEVGITAADTAYHWLREQGLYVPREIVRSEWREYKFTEMYSEDINRWPGHYLIPRSLYAETESKRIEAYGVKADVTVYNKVTGEWEKATWFVPSEKRMTKDELIDYIKQGIKLSPDEYEAETAEAEFYAFYHRKGAEW